MVFFLLGSTTKIVCAPLLSPIGATYPTNLILLDLITRIISGEEYRSLISFLGSLLLSRLTLLLLGLVPQLLVDFGNFAKIA